MQQGLNAATKLIRARTNEAVEREFDRFLTQHQVRALHRLTHGDPS